jgi:hypothetical protein
VRTIVGLSFVDFEVRDGEEQSKIRKHKAPEVLTTPGASFLGSGRGIRASLHAAGGRAGDGGSEIEGNP